MTRTRDDTRFTVRLLDARDDLEFVAAATGEPRSEVVRRLVREEARRLEQETTTRKESDHE